MPPPSGSRGTLTLTGAANLSPFFRRFRGIRHHGNARRTDGPPSPPPTQISATKACRTAFYVSGAPVAIASATPTDLVQLLAPGRPAGDCREWLGGRAGLEV